MKEDLSVSVVTMNWYRREDYDRLLTIFEDASHFPRSYDDWLKKAEHGDNLLRKQGKQVVRVVINYDEFTAWCAARKLKINGHTRNMFAAAKSKDIVFGRNN
jgi:hypothetical protein